MAFNKLGMVLLLMLLATAITPSSESAGKPNFCTFCECKKESDKTKCYRTERKIGGCPLSCGKPNCACTRMIPPTCWCSIEVDSCNPSQCPIKSTPAYKLDKGN
ncbi:hypothetical protein TIFTF001_023870 [Ficus carica]|uniref:Bowman-Birk serine protease inhibitors family domain-containing protein n=1 Tax=Ficus carica TaxID=3494 RepID=A0AA88DCU3_FICCA|nr:hypothetical protein TIFTF001_023870 [Ficus carica]